MRDVFNVQKVSVSTGMSGFPDFHMYIVTLVHDSVKGSVSVEEVS